MTDTPLLWLRGQASDLNLRLMRWRMWPSLDTDALQVRLVNRY